MFYGVLGVRNNRIFRGIEWDASDVWSFERFCVTLWALMENSLVIIRYVFSCLIMIGALFKEFPLFEHSFWDALVLFHLF